MKLKDVCSYDQPRQHIKKQRHYFANIGLSSQGYGFSSGHVWMGKLDYKETDSHPHCERDTNILRYKQTLEIDTQH